MTNFNYKNIEQINQYNETWEDYNFAIKQVCKKYNIDCFDVYNEITFNDDVYTLDGIHPTQSFLNDIFAPQVAQFIKDNYKK